jgi:hypothetical protein
MSRIEIVWMLRGIDNVGISSDKKVYRMPYNLKERHYSLREIESHIHIGIVYYRINRKRYSKKRINELCKKLKHPKIIHLIDGDLPF